jgi:predicted dehydrogenase
MRVGLVGCGLIGRRRAEVVHRSPGDELVVVADVVEASAHALAGELGCEGTSDWEQVANRTDVDAVIVATTHNWLAPITTEALKHGKHVLVEKPMARNAEEAEAILKVATDHAIVKVGFNHRHHAAIWKAHEVFDQGVIGRPLFMRCRYGHGGRPGYDKEWRTDRQKSGGGELLDQGIHAIDLCRWFLGDFSEVSSFTATYVWAAQEEQTVAGKPSSTASEGVEDNAFALFRTAAGQVVSLHASWTQWKNLFSLEIFGEEGYLIVEGLGGSYGAELLKVGRRSMAGGRPQEEVLEFPDTDLSWEAEWREFVEAVGEGRQPLANGHDGYQALKAVQGAYESARTGSVVRL